MNLITQNATTSDMFIIQTYKNDLSSTNPELKGESKTIADLRRGDFHCTWLLDRSSPTGALPKDLLETTAPLIGTRLLC